MVMIVTTSTASEAYGYLIPFQIYLGKPFLISNGTTHKHHVVAMALLRTVAAKQYQGSTGSLCEAGNTFSGRKNLKITWCSRRK